MDKETVKAANKVWSELVATAKAMPGEKFVIQVTVYDISLISYALGCALGYIKGEDNEQ